MITPDEFKVLSDKIIAGETITNEEARELLAAVYEMDTNLIILQNTLELSVLNVQDIVPNLSALVLRLSGRTDNKIKKKVAQISAEVVGNFGASIQMYLSGAYEEAQNLVTKIMNGEEYGTTESLPDSGETIPEDSN